jgi:cytochrome c-type biogenesis protein CcmH
MMRLINKIKPAMNLFFSIVMVNGQRPSHGPQAFFKYARPKTNIPTAILILGVCFSVNVLAETVVHPDHQLADERLEQAARQITNNLRCVTCPNETVAASRTRMARDIRRYVRRQLSAGMTPDQIRQDLKDRYGPDITYAPPLSPATIILWSSPILLIIIAVFGIIIYHRRDKPS